MDLSQLSTADLQALQAGDLTKVSTQGLQLLKQASDPAFQAAQAKANADTQAWAATVSPTSDMSTTDRFLAGIGKGMTDLGRGIGERLGIVSPQDIADSRAVDAPLMATTAGQVGNVAGKVAVTVPTMFIPGANTLAGAAITGAAQGALEPTTDGESVLGNTALGAVGGAAGYGAGKYVLAPVVGAAVRGVRAAGEPLYAAGQQRIIGRALNNAAGSDADQVQNALAQAAQPFVGPSQPGLARATMGEIVPGSMPTVGQVAAGAGNAGVPALERAATATNPSVTNALSAQLSGQNDARVNALLQLAGSDGERDFAAANRAATADQLYGDARANGIDPAALTPEAQANIAAMQARIPSDILAQAKQLAQIQGMPMDDTTSVAGLHYVKMALDDAISSAKASGNATKARALTGLQNDFLTGLDNLSPDYAAARSTFQTMSAPVNQMDVAQAIADKAINPLTGSLQPAAYARALNDATAARATGLPGATLEGTLTDQQQNALQAILEDVQRSNAAQNAGRGPGSDTVQKLAYSNLLQSAGGPDALGQRGVLPAVARVIMATPALGAGVRVAGGLAARGADSVYGDANRRLADQLAATMLSPQDAADAMNAASLYDAPNALQVLLQRSAPLGLTLARAGVPAVTLPVSGQR